MKTLYCTIFFSLLLLSSCSQLHTKNPHSSPMQYKHTNQLINESSPYLLQHSHNPVNWYPWGEEALDKAKKENKLIIVSIGYSACHWCHVMEHESFEDENIAQFMNDHFIAIKVDREERPDIDQVYMNAVQLITGGGGWPLNCITLPDGRPIYGGTYFTKSQWLNMLKQVSEFVKQNPDKTKEQAELLTNGIQSQERIYTNPEQAKFSLNDLNTIFSNWKTNIDTIQGGHKRAPKFPLPIGYQYLLHYNYLSQDQEALEAVTTTLNKMADGGIYDQIGGGFARYSTDEMWKVPHFEKMLYDNAQLVSLYSAAYQKTRDPYYKIIVNETLNFIQRELTSEDGGFYSSLDADSEGIEGKFYVWKMSEIRNILGKKADLICDYYSITEKGNWENGNNILFKTNSDKKTADKYKTTESALAERISEAKNLLLQERENRIRPGLDDKILTSWNSLMLKAYIDAYRVFDNKEYLLAALKNAEFIISEMKLKDYRLYRNYKEGKASINGFLDDYAFSISAFIALYQATFEEKWLVHAKRLADYVTNHFNDKNSQMFFYTSDIDPALIARKMEISDNVIPSANSEMAKNLFVLGHYFYDDNLIKKSRTMLNNVKQNTKEGGAYYANWDILMAWFAAEPYEVAIVGNDFEAIRKEFDRFYLPMAFLSGGKNEGTLSLLKSKLIKNQTTIYVCKNKECKLPTTDVKTALKLSHFP